MSSLLLAGTCDDMNDDLSSMYEGDDQFESMGGDDYESDMDDRLEKMPCSEKTILPPLSPQPSNTMGSESLATTFFRLRRQMGDCLEIWDSYEGAGYFRSIGALYDDAGDELSYKCLDNLIRQLNKHLQKVLPRIPSNTWLPLSPIPLDMFDPCLLLLHLALGLQLTLTAVQGSNARSKLADLEAALESCRTGVSAVRRNLKIILVQAWGFGRTPPAGWCTTSPGNSSACSPATTKAAASPIFKRCSQ
jgi:hypothetical protein